MTLSIPTSKPRNLLALAARQRNAGAHEAVHPQRTARRQARQGLQKNLLRDITESET
ncbi:hypothetical protein [Undibacterium sp. SXout20W]|uniref:hypothetical protein n=1 Tax=Undibacterium sp. SXout20W TaxID=3413051 RepID=UPI003BF2A480